MSLTFYLMLLAAIALAVVLLAALAIYWHAEARDWAQIAMLAIDAAEVLPYSPMFRKNFSIGSFSCLAAACKMRAFA